jgi:N-acetylmuramoyl-L-alanine amidase
MMKALKATAVAAIVVLLLWSLLEAQGTPPASPLMLISRDGRRAVPTVTLSGQELIGLDDVASLFGVTVREDALAGGITITYRGRTIVMSADQPMASVSGRVVTLPSPVVRAAKRALVPIEFLTRALAPIYDQRIELRRNSRLLIVGDVRVPQVGARIDAPGPPTRATLEVIPSGAVSYATEAGRVVLRIDADAIDLSAPAAGAGLIEQIRAGDQPTSIVVQLSARAATPRVVQTTADNATRILIEVPSNAPAETAAAPAPPPPPAAEPPTLVLTPRSALETIVIDPGHGGEDVGARGPSGIEEKAITLEVARRLRGLIEARLGIRVILTRDDDRAVGADQRAALANNSKADLFLSLHVNGAPSPMAAGAEVFHLRLDREGEDARRAAQAEAVSLPILGGATREVEVIQWDMAQARHVDASAVLAGMLEAELATRVTMSPRPLQQAPLRVLVGANMPAALVEMAYLTNPAQEKVVRSDAYQGLVAQAIFDAIVKFREYLEGQPLH